jgi:hypothetical protein
MNANKIVDGQMVMLTPEEYAAEMAGQETTVLPQTQSAPTKEQLMAELAALTAKIQALE